MVRTRRELSIFLSHLAVFNTPNISLEQYPSDGNTAAKLLWQASLDGAIEDTTIIDLGCGTGILGIGCLLLGAKHIIFTDIDPKVKPLLQKNMAFLEEHYDVPGTWEFIVNDVTNVQAISDVTVVMNPPFGTKRKHIDKKFLEKAISLSNNVYSMHKTSTKGFLEAFARSHDLDLWMEDVSFPLQNTMIPHRKKLDRIEVTLIRFRN